MLIVKNILSTGAFELGRQSKNYNEIITLFEFICLKETLTKIFYTHLIFMNLLINFEFINDFIILIVNFLLSIIEY